MQSNHPAGPRPRTLGEILDDGWRLYLAESAALLAASGLFFFPAMMVLLWVLANPWTGDISGWLVVVLSVGLFTGMGLASGFSQEVFHRWGEKLPVTFRVCFHSTKKRLLNHLTSQALLGLLPLATVLSFLGGQAVLGTILLMVWAPVWAGGLAWNAVLAGGQRHVWKALRYSRHCAARHPLKVAVIVASRLCLFLLGIINLHLALLFFLWVGDNVAGLSTGFLNLVISLRNPVYLVLIATVVWWLLTPFHEAVNYLFYVDARCRHEGMDLTYRMEELFPQVKKHPMVAAGLLLTFFFYHLEPAQGANRPEDFRKAMAAIQAVQEEMREANPYPGGQKWQPLLRRIGDSLDTESDSSQGKFRWFFQAIEEVKSDRRERDIVVLNTLEKRLEILEKNIQPRKSPSSTSRKEITLRDIRKLVPPLEEELVDVKKSEKKKKENKEQIKEDKDFLDLPAQNGAKSGGGIIPPVQIAGGFVQFILLFLVAIIVVVLVAGLFFLLVNWLRSRQPRGKPFAMGQTKPLEEEYLENPDRQNVQSLWQRADDLAAKGQCLEALRVIYLTVLAMLHQAHLIRYERTKTNGEYADQLRRRIEIQPLFLMMTSFFELKWYGERSCASFDYEHCRQLALQLQESVRVQE